MMDSKQTPQHRIEQGGKVIFKPDADHPLTAEHVGWMATLRDGTVFGPLDMDDDEFYLFDAGNFCWTASGCYYADSRPSTLDIVSVSPPEAPSQSEPPQASEEARPTATITRDEMLPHLNRCTEIVSQWPQWQQELIGKTSSRDEELRRLREKNERLRVRIKELERMALDAKSFWVTEEEFKSVAAAVGLSNAPPSHVFAAVPQIIATLERHYSEARGLVCVSFLESLHDGVRNNGSWHNAHYERITKTFSRHDQERAACKPCGEPLTKEHDMNDGNHTAQCMRDAAKICGFEMHNAYHFTHCATIWLCQVGEVRISGNDEDGWSASLVVDGDEHMFSGGNNYTEAVCGLVHSADYASKPLTHSEAEKICAGEPVRQGEDLAALQAENKLLSDQRDLAYNWLATRDKEMFDQKYPKEVRV